MLGPEAMAIGAPAHGAEDGVESLGERAGLEGMRPTFRHTPPRSG
jgi:hypothetical protein